MKKLIRKIQGITLVSLVVHNNNIANISRNSNNANYSEKMEYFTKAKMATERYKEEEIKEKNGNIKS